MTDAIVEITVDEIKGKVYAACSSQGELPGLEDILNAAKAEGVVFWLDEAAIAKALEKRVVDTPFEIGHARDGRVIVTLAPGEKEAHMVLEPACGGRALDFTDVEEALSEKLICIGIDEAAIRQALAEGNYRTRIRIARGRDPLNGTDAVIEYLFPRGLVHAPRDTGDKRIDYRDLESITSVRTDAVLARKIPATRGEDGITVTDRPIRAVPGKDARLIPGKNTRLSGNGLELISNIDGQPILLDKVSVEPVITIDGDVDYSTGNVDFSGSVRILGSVISGFSVKATANIQIDGVVEDAYVEAGADVLIRGGVRGRGRRTVKAGGNVRALFIEQASVEAGVNIFAQEVLHSALVAGDQVRLSEGKGLIFGGRVAATNLIHAKTAGGDSDIHTELAVGFNPQQKAALDALKEEQLRHEITLSEVETGIATLERSRAEGSSMWQRHTETYEKLVETRRQLTDKLDGLAFEINTMEDRIIHADQARIKIAKTVYPNVVIRIGRFRFQNENELTSTSFYQEEGEIKSTVYVL